VSVGADGTTHIHWNNANGAASLWNYNTSTGSFTHGEYGPFAGYTAVGVADGADGRLGTLWNNADGTMSLWSLNNTLGDFTHFEYGPYSGWTAVMLSGTQ